MHRLLLLAAALTATFVFASPVSAEDPASGAIVDVDDSAFPEVRVIVTVLDAASLPVTGLGPEAFVAQESGSSAAVTRVETVLDQQLGVAVILTVDTSGSMLGQAMTQAKAAASVFVRSLEDPDQVAVVSFANTVTSQSGLTSDRQASLASIDRLAALGNTALYSGVVEAVSQARAASLPRRAIILLSDGEDFGGVSTASRDDALGLAGEARIPIYAIGLGSTIDAPFLEELAQRSGGVFLRAPQPETIPAVYNQLSQLLRSQYVLRLNSTADANATQRSLRLNVRSGTGDVQLDTQYGTRRSIPPTPVPVVAPPPAVLPVEEQGSDGTAVIMVGIFLLMVAGILAFGFMVLNQRKREYMLDEQIAQLSSKAVAELQGGLPQRKDESRSATFLVVEGPDGSRRIEVGQEPMTVGSGPDCSVRLENASGRVAEEHARVWSMEGKLIFHQLSSAQSPPDGGNAVAWVSLNNGEEVEVGPYRIRVEVIHPVSASA